VAFAPGQFITAQRLNRLQTKTYWAAASGTTPVSSAGVDMAGTTIPVTIETAGATVTISWSVSVYATAVTMASSGSARAFFGADSSPNFALFQDSDANAKGSVANFWMTTVAAAGAYNAKLVVTTPAQATMSNYSSILVKVDEVA
jgi:hypothetical protein